ncbi:MAG TPA: alpha/beta hydrolase domain-containing protein, partial [Myxococcaceae bacterium]|nr:alpha/beta hydrolase domain-containing protein [Myxococcaceae bacterium]
MRKSSRIPSPMIRPALVAVTVALLAQPAAARVVRIVIDTVSPLDNGAYEALSGRAFGELDPTHPLNAIIQDIQLGKDPDGKVRYVASFSLVKPVDLRAASGLMWHDVPNRGGRITLAASSRAEGDIGLSSGWQGDNAGNTTVPPYARELGPQSVVVNREWTAVPIAKHQDGSPVTGLVFGRIVNRSGPASQLIRVQANPLPYKPATLDTTQATLVVRAHETMEGVVTGETQIASSDWAWAKCMDWASRTPLLPTDAPEICLKNGFDPNRLYQVVFTARDPYVLGVGFAAFRDMASFFRNQVADDVGTPNPVAGAVKWVISRGVSQSGNFLRGFLHLGFNQDESGQPVYDGMWPIIAGRRIALNFRWAQPDGVLELYQAGSEGPQWWHKFPDHVRGLPPGGIM